MGKSVRQCIWGTTLDYNLKVSKLMLFDYLNLNIRRVNYIYANWTNKKVLSFGNLKKEWAKAYVNVYEAPPLIII